MSKLMALACLAMAIMMNVMPAKAEELSAQDKQFIKEAASGGALEVRLGEYAAQNAGTDEIKRFGEHMVGDHDKANDQLKDIATQQPIEIPKEMTQEDTQTLQKLESLKGAEFDKIYIVQMVQDHEKDVASFEKEAASGSDLRVKSFAEKTLPVLKHHLEMAQELQKRLRA